jgi:hypothetical protein
MTGVSSPKTRPESLHPTRARTASSGALPSLRAGPGDGGGHFSAHLANWRPEEPAEDPVRGAEHGRSWLVELRITNPGPRAFFTENGLAALRQLVLDRRAMDPERFGHLRRELGLE